VFVDLDLHSGVDPFGVPSAAELGAVVGFADAEEQFVFDVHFLLFYYISDSS
jgi:hypothetical protein